jgi:hypothetical protein
VYSTTDKTLGPIIFIYHDRPLRWRDLLIIFIPGVLAVLAPLLYGLKRAIYASTYYGPVAAENWSWPWIGLATVALIPLLLLAIRRLRQSHRRVTLHKNGLNIRWTGSQDHNLSWDQIQGLACITTVPTFLGSTSKPRLRLTLYPISGKLIHIDDRLNGLPDLAERIKAKIYPRLLPQMRTAFHKGETLHFGPVRIHQQAINIRGREIPWEKVSRVNVNAGKLVVESQTKSPIRMSVEKIPNIELLIQVLQEGVNP